MAKIGGGGRRNLAGFTGGEEYSPPIADQAEQREQAVQSEPVTEATAVKATSGNKPPASKPVRKNWTFNQDFVDGLLESKADWVHEGRDEGRHIRYSNLAEQAWIAALSTWAMEQLKQDLKQGPSHGLAGEIHKYFPENSRAVRGYH